MSTDHQQQVMRSADMCLMSVSGPTPKPCKRMRDEGGSSVGGGQVRLLSSQTGWEGVQPTLGLSAVIDKEGGCDAERSLDIPGSPPPCQVWDFSEARWGDD